MLPVQPTSKDSSNTKATHTDWNFLERQRRSNRNATKRNEKLAQK